MATQQSTAAERAALIEAKRQAALRRLKEKQSAVQALQAETEAQAIAVVAAEAEAAAAQVVAPPDAAMTNLPPAALPEPASTRTSTAEATADEPPDDAYVEEPDDLQDVVEAVGFQVWLRAEAQLECSSHVSTVGSALRRVWRGALQQTHMARVQSVCVLQVQASS